MILQIEDWKFEIDMDATMAYSAQEAAEHCDCQYCRNYYAAIDNAHPRLRPFLARFGLDIEAPDELMPFTESYMIVLYSVCGSILTWGSGPIDLDGLLIEPELREASHINTVCPEPLFTVGFELRNLPWVLDEPFEDAVSPANRSSFLKRMMDKLLGRSSGKILQ